jgi:hypothetical protein
VTPRTRWIVVALALAGAVALAFAVQGARWWSAGTVGIGPGGTRVCFEGAGCRVDDLAWLDAGELWRRAGLATMVASLLTTFALIALAASIVARKGGTMAAGAVLTATFTAVVAGAIFLAKVPDVAAGSHPQLSSGVAIWAVGLIVGVVAAVLRLRASR